MPIIDAQIHLWRTGAPHSPHTSKPFLVEDALSGMDDAGIDRALIHPPAGWDPLSNDQAVEAVLAYPCLLYTSPSPRDGLLSRMPSSA